MRKLLPGLAVAMTLVGWSLPANAVVIEELDEAKSSTGESGLEIDVGETDGDNLWITESTLDCWAAGSGKSTADADELISTGFSSCEFADPTSGEAEWASDQNEFDDIAEPFASSVTSLDGDNEAEERDILTEGELPKEGESLGEGDIPTEGDILKEVAVLTEGETLAERDILTETEIPTEGEVARESDESEVEESDEGARDVPEPGTLIVFGIGLLGLGFARRRRQNN